MADRLSRRSILTATGGGVVGLAGCFGVGEFPESDTDDDATADDAAPDEADPSEWEATGSPLDASFDVAVAVENLEIPWGLAFAPNGDVFLSERPGRIRRGTVEDVTGDEPTDGTEVAEEPVELPDLAPTGEAGVLDLTVHPSYPDPASVYVFYTAEEDGLVDRVVRYDATDPEEVEPVVDDLPGAVHHNGGRLAFGPDDHLWITRGDVSDPDASQEPGSLVGSILRVTEDGDPAGSDEAPEDADPRVFSYGHRNVQGLDWLPDGTPITTEHGPTARDEVNLLTPGANYGWPIARGGPDDPDYEAYDDAFSPPVASSGTTDGADTWAPSGGTWYDHEAFPELQHRFLFAGLRSQRIHVLSLLDSAADPPEDATAVHDEAWLDDRYLAVRHELLVEAFGRIRHVVTGPDGALYFLTSNEDDVIGRLDPA